MDGKIEDRVASAFKSRMSDLRRLWKAELTGVEDEELGWLIDYGLSFDYVPKGTYIGQDEGYFRYQLSWGGPGDEFRFYCDPALEVERVEYWFYDWYVGASIVLEGEDEELLIDIFEWFKEAGVPQKVLEESLEL